MQSPEAIPLSLYVHIPWCMRKCPYCDFNSHAVGEDDIPQQSYIDALLKDLEFHLPEVWGRRISSIFIGGGTPSLLSPETINRLIVGIRTRLACLPGLEITLEANPGTLETESFCGFREAGITRLSIGVQSFSDTSLARLGRIHSGEEALQAVATAIAAGFDSVNLDLMFGLPGQSMQAAMQDLELALSLHARHMSLYQLTIEPNTPFSHRRPEGLPEDDLLADMQEQLAGRLATEGCPRYEVSAYATKGHHCRHNLNYWQFGDYLGIGAGAHSKLSTADEIYRFSKPRLPKQYLVEAGQASAVTSRRVLDDVDRCFEFMLNALRLRRGFTRDLFEGRTRLAYAAIEDRVWQATDMGLLEADGATIRPTETGYRFLSDTQLLFS
jgi:oxygen-independent coproporphyrinogen-3 oxidase